MLVKATKSKRKSNMEGKVCLVTGANAGIGKEVCMALAAKGAEVVMSARNRQQAEQVREQIIESTGNPRVHVLLADLSSFREVINLTDTFRSEHQKLDVLVNNAGIFLTEYQETVDGIETQWMVNHLAPYLITRRLMDLLKSSSDARIINVSSNAHFQGKIDFDDLNGSGHTMDWLLTLSPNWPIYSSPRNWPIAWWVLMFPVLHFIRE